MAACTSLRLEGKPSEKLRAMRERLRLSLRDVRAISKKLSAQYHNPSYLIHPSRLSEYETREITPSTHHLYALSVCYRTPLVDLLSFYVPVNNTIADWENTQLRNTHAITLQLSEENGSAHEFEQ